MCSPPTLIQSLLRLHIIYDSQATTTNYAVPNELTVTNSNRNDRNC